MLTGRRGPGWTAYLLLWAGLVVGAIAGALAYPRLGAGALWLASGLAVLLGAFAMTIRPEATSPDGRQALPSRPSGIGYRERKTRERAMATVADGKVRANAEPVLTDEQIATYRRDGLVKVDVRKILGEDAFERMREAFLYAEADDYRAHPGTDPYPATVLYREIHKSYPALAEFALSPKLGAVAAQLIGCDHVRLFGDETFTKLPGMPMTIWHQDSSTLPFDKPDFLTLWMAIDDVDP